MFEGLWTPALAPFTIALGVMLLIALTEIMGAFFGISPGNFLDELLPGGDAGLDLDAEAESGVAGQGTLSQLLGWLCIGKVPVLVLLVAFLTAFGLAGFVLQAIVMALLGFHLPAFLAIVWYRC